MTTQKTIVIALGGNSILRAKEKGTIEEQYTNLNRTGEELRELLDGTSRVVITHGNGPQVGNVLLASETAKEIVPTMPLDICVASTQGFMGFMIQDTLANHLRKAGLKHNITTVITQVVVNKDDPAFRDPSKPIGPYYSMEEANRLRQEKGLHIIEDSGRGYRRVVPSPVPIKTQQSRIIKSMLDAGEIVIAVGGGGIPVVRENDGSLRGVEAVIDKDLASARLGIEINADILLILTAVEFVYTDFGRPNQRAIRETNLSDIKKLLAEGQFGKGSMEPKIRAAIRFLEDSNNGGSAERDVIITLPAMANKALRRETGTLITK